MVDKRKNMLYNPKYQKGGEERTGESICGVAAANIDTAREQR